MSKKETKQEIELILNDNLENVFTDLILVHVNQENVSFELAIRDKNNKTAKVSHNIILTLPHFLRFADVCNKTAKKITDQLNELKKAQK